MKKIFICCLAVTGLMIFLSSCKKDETKVVASIETAGTLSTSTTTPTLNKEIASNTALTLKMTSTSVSGYQANIKYTVQYAIAGTNFAKYKEVSASSLTQSVLVGDLNNYLLSLGATADISTGVDIRVKSVIAANESPAYSNVVTLTATPYSLASYLYVVGAFQGWTLGTASTLISATSNGIYMGTVTFTAGNREFLVLPQNTSYDNKYATNEPTSATSTTIAVNAPNNLVAPATAGKYLITLNVNDKTISFTSTP